MIDLRKIVAMSRAGSGMRLAGQLGCALLVLTCKGVGHAQPVRGATVSWSADPVTAARGETHAVINLRGSIREGWHVYALRQSATGPTPLVVAIERNDVARQDGRLAESVPTIAFEPAYGFATPYYIRDVTISVPVRLRERLAAGRQTVPVSLRYQSCDGRTCEPPKTIRVAAQIDIKASS